MATVIKAQRSPVDIAGIEVFGYLLPNNTYKLAGRNVTDAIEEEHKTLPRKLGVKSLKDLPNNDLSLGQIKAISGETFIPVSIEDAIEYWYIMSLSGNKKAAALLKALAIESIERRFDRAFNKEVSEKERDLRLAERFKRLEARKEWTDIIKEIQECRGYYNTPMGTEEFKELTVLVNLKLFGTPHFKCNRDNMTPLQQKRITQFESGLAMFAENRKASHSAEQIVKNYLVLVA